MRPVSGLPATALVQYGNAKVSSFHLSPLYGAARHAGLDHNFPEIETWPNQFPGYEIVVDDPEFTSVCPKTGLPTSAIS